MNEEKIAENAQFLIEVGLESDQAWELARLIAESREVRTDEENDLIQQALKQAHDNISRLWQGYAYVRKLESELHEQDIQDCHNEILSGIEDGQHKKYKEIGSPYGDTKEGFAKWQIELDNLNRMQERLQQMLENIE